MVHKMITLSMLMALAAGSGLIANRAFAQSQHATAGFARAANPAGAMTVSYQPQTCYQPTSFYFNYRYEPQPGRRNWYRVDANVWIERYPNGQETPFQVIGRIEVDGDMGTLVTHTPTDGFYVFIPDKGSRYMWLRFKVGTGSWQWLGEMHHIR